LPAFLSALHSIAQVFRYVAPISASLSELQCLYGSLSLEKTYVKAGMVKRV
jgi:hypothetical protein